jgi:hypothetical protein
MSRSSARRALVASGIALALAFGSAGCGDEEDDVNHRGLSARKGTQLGNDDVSVGVVSADEGEDAGLQVAAGGDVKTVILRPGERAEVGGHVIELVAIEGKGDKGTVWVEIDP